MPRPLLLVCILVLTAWVPATAAGESGGAGTAAPGRLLGRAGSEYGAMFSASWAYRSQTYEIYHHDSTRLASLAYALARHSGDIDGSMAPDRFVAGVKGFHYQVGQVCDWLNDLFAGKGADPGLDELVLAGYLLEDKILVFQGGRLVPAGPVRHVLGAAPGRKRSFAANLRHERLHILWDEDPGFRDNNLKAWAELGADEKNRVRRRLPQYPAEAQLVEEWAVGRAEEKTDK